MPTPSSIDLEACEASLQTGSRSFHLASRVLPRRVRQPAAILYAFCREADDLVDNGGGRPALEQLRARVDRLAGTPGGRDGLLAQVLVRHQIPLAVLHALLDGFARDVDHQQPENLDGLLDYAVRVAGTVGVAMALMMGVRDRRALQAALALGVAMQLTNICRDVGEDAGIGRVYLPRSWLAEAGLDLAAWRHDPRPEPALASVVLRVLGLADQYYALAQQGMALLPADCRTGIAAASRLYAGIGHALRARGGDAVTRRTVLGPLQKLSCLVWSRVTVPVGGVEPASLLALERAGSFLLQACPPAMAGASAVRARRQPWLVEVIDLFERLERRAMAARASGTAARTPGLEWRG